MKKLLISLTLIIIGQQLCRCVFNLAGKSTGSSDDDKPKTVRDFMNDLSGIEMPDANKQNASRIFQKGAELQFNGQIAGAENEYGKLKTAPFNLTDKSKSLNFNLNLLEKQNKK